MVSLTSEAKASLDTLIDSVVKNGKLPAYVAGATTSDGEIYFNAAGKKVAGDESSAEIDPDTVLWMCSMTKLITHIAALQLIDSRVLDPEFPVAEMLNQLRGTVIAEDDISEPRKAVGPSTSVLRVKHLLNFTSGSGPVQSTTGGTALPSVYLQEYPMRDKVTAFFDHLKGDLPGVPLNFEPGTDFVYGHSSDILGFIIELLTAQTLDSYMKKHIFKPLGITGSFYLTPSVKEKLLPITYRNPRDGKLEPFANQPHTAIIAQDPTKVLCFGGAGLYMSPRDYLALLRHLLQILEGKAEEPILKRETVQSLFVPQLPEKGVETMKAALHWMDGPGGISWGNAMAVSTEDWEGRRKAGSGYWGGWLGTSFWIDPKAGIAGVTGTQLLCVTSGAGDPEQVKATGAFEKGIYTSLA